MRKIKFRGLADEHVWVYGWFTDDDLSPDIIDGMNTRHKVLSKTVGQYTGLTDCKGQEIFEGDILRYLPPWRWVDTKRIGVVVFQNYGFYVKNEYVTESLFNIAVNSDGVPFEVIGNVHDNPELLEATE